MNSKAEKGMGRQVIDVEALTGPNRKVAFSACVPDAPTVSR